MTTKHKEWRTSSRRNTCLYRETKESMTKEDALKYFKKLSNSIISVEPYKKEPWKKTKLLVTFEVDVEYHCQKDLDYVLRSISTIENGELVDICHQGGVDATNNKNVTIKQLDQ